MLLAVGAGKRVVLSKIQETGAVWRTVWYLEGVAVCGSLLPEDHDPRGNGILLVRLEILALRATCCFQDPEHCRNATRPASAQGNHEATARTEAERPESTRAEHQYFTLSGARRERHGGGLCRNPSRQIGSGGVEGASAS